MYVKGVIANSKLSGDTANMHTVRLINILISFYDIL